MMEENQQPLENLGRARHLDPKVKILWALNVILAALVFWVVVTAILTIFTEDLFGVPKVLYPIAVLLVIGLLLLPYYLWLSIEYDNFIFYLSNTHLIIKKGVFSLERSVIPYAKIQNINIERSIAERFLNLATIKIETAGTHAKESEVIIPAVADYKSFVNEILFLVEEAKKELQSTQETGKKNELLESEKEFKESIREMVNELRSLKEIVKTIQQKPAPKPLDKFTKKQRKKGKKK